MSSQGRSKSVYSGIFEHFAAPKFKRATSSTPASQASASSPRDPATEDGESGSHGDGLNQPAKANGMILVDISEDGAPASNAKAAPAPHENNKEESTDNEDISASPIPNDEEAASPMAEAFPDQLDDQSEGHGGDGMEATSPASPTRDGKRSLKHVWGNPYSNLRSKIQQHGKSGKSLKDVVLPATLVAATASTIARLRGWPNSKKQSNDASPQKEKKKRSKWLP